MKKVINHWLLHRVSAVVLIPIMLWFLFHLSKIFLFSYADALQFLKIKFNAILICILVTVALFHFRIGFGEILEDYLHHEKLKKIITTIVLIISIIIPVVVIVLMAILVL
jgi:succinate dehydrogenase / fumarate reductase membrane anchor subunit